MRISEIECHVLLAPNYNPAFTSSAQDSFVVIVRTDQGVFGVGESPGPGFIAWRDYVTKTPNLMCGALIKRATPHLTDAEAAAYDAPFPDQAYKAGVRRFPALVPIAPDMDGVAVSKAARDWWETQFNGPSFMAIGMKDPVLGLPVMTRLRTHIRGCPMPFEVPEGGHFVQEWGAEIADAALAHFAIAARPAPR